VGPAADRPRADRPESRASPRLTTDPALATILLRLRPPAGEREPAPILRLRYQGSADQWVIEIYLASSDQYTEAELPTSFGPKTGTPEEGVDDTSILYAGPKTGH
jgi:hypothetical protein